MKESLSKFANRQILVEIPHGGPLEGKAIALPAWHVGFFVTVVRFVDMRPKKMRVVPS